MLVADDRCKVAVRFRDREGNERPTALSFPFGISDSDLEAALDLFITYTAPISDAVIVSWSVTRIFEESGPNTAADGADLDSKVLLFYQNGDAYESIWIPAPNAELFELTGDYAGIRVAAADPTVAGLLDDLQAVVEFICTPEGEPFPTTYLVGGLAL